MCNSVTDFIEGTFYVISNSVVECFYESLLDGKRKKHLFTILENRFYTLVHPNLWIYNIYFHVFIAYPYRLEFIIYSIFGQYVSNSIKWSLSFRQYYFVYYIQIPTFVVFEFSYNVALIMPFILTILQLCK